MSPAGSSLLRCHIVKRVMDMTMEAGSRGATVAAVGN
jgi:hypothetical protein